MRGLYHINAVDCITQFEIVATCERLSEAYLLPVIDALLGSFPFQILGFHELENFSQQELFRLGMVGRAVMQRTEAQYYLHKNGFLDDEFREMRRSWMRGWFDMPVWAEWWKTERDQGTVTLSFIANVESAPPILVVARP